MVPPSVDIIFSFCSIFMLPWWLLSCAGAWRRLLLPGAYFRLFPSEDLLRQQPPLGVFVRRLPPPDACVQKQSLLPPDVSSFPPQDVCAQQLRGSYPRRVKFSQIKAATHPEWIESSPFLLASAIFLDHSSHASCIDDAAMKKCRASWMLGKFPTDDLSSAAIALIPVQTIKISSRSSCNASVHCQPAADVVRRRPLVNIDFFQMLYRRRTSRSLRTGNQ